MDIIAHPKTYQRATETALYVRSMLPEALQNPKVAIVCGSGLGGLADTIESDPKVELPYGSVPNFPQSTGKWHRHSEITGTNAQIRLKEAADACGLQFRDMQENLSLVS